MHRPRISASGLGKFTHFGCDKLVALTLQQGVEKRQVSSFQQAHFDRGLAFEARLKNRLSNLIDCTKDKSSVDRLIECASGTVLYQAMLPPLPGFFSWLKARFYDEHLSFVGFDAPTDVPFEFDNDLFSKSQPDFLFVRDEIVENVSVRVVYILDSKSSPRVEPSHQTQICFYALLLEAYCRHRSLQNGSSDEWKRIQIADIGGVWLPSDLDRPDAIGPVDPLSCQQFELSYPKSKLLEFMVELLPTLLKTPPEQTDWLLTSVCAECEFVDQCVKQSRDSQTVALLPTLTDSQRRWIRSLLRSEKAAAGDAAAAAVTEIEQLGELLSPKSSTSSTSSKDYRSFGKSILRQLCNFLNINLSEASSAPNAAAFSPHLDAVRTQKVQLRSVANASFPSDEDIAICLSIDFDPQTRGIFAFDILLSSQHAEMFKAPVDKVTSPVLPVQLHWSSFVADHSKIKDDDFASASIWQFVLTMDQLLSSLLEIQEFRSFRHYFMVAHENFLPTAFFKCKASTLRVSCFTLDGMQRKSVVNALTELWNSIDKEILNDDAEDEHDECNDVVDQLSEAVAAVSLEDEAEAIEDEPADDEIPEPTANEMDSDFTRTFGLSPREWLRLEEMKRRPFNDSRAHRMNALQRVLLFFESNVPLSMDSLPDLLGLDTLADRFKFLKSKVKKDDLKTMCRDRGLSDEGTIPILSDRLADYEFKIVFADQSVGMDSKVKLKKWLSAEKIRLQSVVTRHAYPQCASLMDAFKYHFLVPNSKILVSYTPDDVVKTFGDGSDFCKHWLASVLPDKTFRQYAADTALLKLKGRTMKLYSPISLNSLKETSELHQMWSSNNTSSSNEQLVELNQKKSQALFGLINVLRNSFRLITQESNALEKHCVLIAAPLTPPIPIYIANPILRRLAFITQVSSLQQCQQIRQKRLTCSIDELVEQNLAIRMKCVDTSVPDKLSAFIKSRGKFRPVQSVWQGETEIENFDYEKANPAASYLTQDSEEGLKEIRCFNDMLAATSFWLPSSISDLVDSSSAASNSEIQFSLPFDVKVGQTLLLHKRFVDFNTPKVLAAVLKVNSNQSTSPFVKMLRSPKQYALNKTVPDGTKILELVQDQRSLHDMYSRFTQSQKEIFDTLASKALTLVWGPPGSGKTFFIAMSILILIFAHKSNADKQDASPLRIYLTGFTHPSIENMIQKILELKSEIFDEDKTGPGFIVAKIKEPSPSFSHTLQNSDKLSSALKSMFFVPDDVLSTSPLEQLYLKGLVKPEWKFSQGSAEPVSPKAAALDAPQKVPDSAKKEKSKSVPALAAGKLDAIILCGTVWALTKHFDADKHHFDLVVVDEASQMPVAHAAIPVSFVKTGTGRLLLAGDPLQLPPILPLPDSMLQDKMLSKLPLHTSFLDVLFRNQSSTEQFHSGVHKLRDNFRMNECLGEATQILYDPDYRCFPQSKNIKRLLNPVNKDAIKHSPFKDFIQAALDPNMKKSLIIGSMNPVSSSSSGNASIMPERAAQLEAQVVFDLVMNGLDATASVFIVTPHHLQRHAVQEALMLDQAELDKRQVRVDTVERMQGQEADVVIVCYSYFDRNSIQNEAEFVYNLNRLNVALTRAHVKTIFLTTDLYLSMPLDMDGMLTKTRHYLTSLKSRAPVLKVDVKI